jgi:hypothetical protein
MANEQESWLISINGLEAVLNHDSNFIKFLRLVNSLKIGIKLWGIRSFIKNYQIVHLENILIKLISKLISPLWA